MSDQRGRFSGQRDDDDGGLDVFEAVAETVGGVTRSLGNLLDDVVDNVRGRGRDGADDDDDDARADKGDDDNDDGFFETAGRRGESDDNDDGGLIADLASRAPGDAEPGAAADQPDIEQLDIEAASVAPAPAADAADVAGAAAAAPAAAAPSAAEAVAPEVAAAAPAAGVSAAPAPAPAPADAAAAAAAPSLAADATVGGADAPAAADTTPAAAASPVDTDDAAAAATPGEAVAPAAAAAGEPTVEREAPQAEDEVELPIAIRPGDDGPDERPDADPIDQPVTIGRELPDLDEAVAQPVTIVGETAEEQGEGLAFPLKDQGQVLDAPSRLEDGPLVGQKQQGTIEDAALRDESIEAEIVSFDAPADAELDALINARDDFAPPDRFELQLDEVEALDTPPDLEPELDELRDELPDDLDDGVDFGDLG